MRAFIIAAIVVVTLFSLTVANGCFVCSLAEELLSLEGMFPNNTSECTSQDPYIERASEVLGKNYNYLNAVCHTEQVLRIKLCLERTRRGYLEGDGAEYRRARVELKEALRALKRSEGLDLIGII